MKSVKIKYTATGKGQGSKVEINVDMTWSGAKEFVRGNEYLVPENVYAELKKLGGFELADGSDRIAESKVEAPKATPLVRGDQPFAKEQEQKKKADAPKHVSKKGGK